MSTLYCYPQLFTDSTLFHLKSLISKNFFIEYTIMHVKVVITLHYVFNLHHRIEVYELCSIFTLNLEEPLFMS